MIIWNATSFVSGYKYGKSAVKRFDVFDREHSRTRIATQLKLRHCVGAWQIWMNLSKRDFIILIWLTERTNPANAEYRNFFYDFKTKYNSIWISNWNHFSFLQRYRRAASFYAYFPVLSANLFLAIKFPIINVHNCLLAIRFWHSNEMNCKMILVTLKIGKSQAASLYIHQMWNETMPFD